MGQHLDRWQKALSGDAGIKEDWHARVVQSQFIDDEAGRLKEMFAAKYTKAVRRAFCSAEVSDCYTVARMAAYALIEAGYKPKINLFWMPDLWTEINCRPHRRPA